MTDPKDKLIRIDRWLWFTRFYKTRRLASAAVNGGHVKVNGERAKPGTRIKEGDVIELVRGQLPYKLEAGPLPLRRGPASEAQRCYFEDDVTLAQRQAITSSIRQDRQQMPTTRGRPDKYTQRKLREYGRRSGSDDPGQDA